MAPDFISEDDLTPDERDEAESGSVTIDGRVLKAWSVDRFGKQWYRATDRPEVRGVRSDDDDEIRAVLDDEGDDDCTFIDSDGEIIASENVPPMRGVDPNAGSVSFDVSHD